MVTYCQTTVCSVLRWEQFFKRGKRVLSQTYPSSFFDLTFKQQSQLIELGWTVEKMRLLDKNIYKENGGIYLTKDQSCPLRPEYLSDSPIGFTVATKRSCPAGKFMLNLREVVSSTEIDKLKGKIDCFVFQSGFSSTELDFTSKLITVIVENS